MAFNNIGHLVVGLFFLWSGWGLGLKTKSKDFSDCKKAFIKKSFMPLFVYTFIFNILKVAIFTGGKIIISKEDFSTIDIAKQIIFLNLPDVTEWYFIILLLIYIFYWFVENIFNKRELKTSIYAVAAGIYILVCWYLGIDGHWYISIIGWFVGYILAVYKGFWERVLDKNWIIKCIITFIVWFSTWDFVIINGNGSLDIAHFEMMLLTIISVICFGILIIYLNSVYALGDYWLKRGDFSLGMYTLHPIVLVGASFLAKHGVPLVVCAVITFVLLLPISYVASRFYKIVKSKMQLKTKHAS